MFTQCQHCLTMFRITPEQLKAADGKVRCCRCNNVFNALQKLVDSPVSFVNDADMQEQLSVTGPDEPSASAPGSLNREAGQERLDIDPSLASDSEIERSLDALADEQTPIEQLSEESILEVDEHSSELDNQNQFLLERDDGLETEPDYFAAGTESQMSELLDQDSASALLDDIDAYDRLAEVISIDNHGKDNLLEAEPAASIDERRIEETLITSKEENITGSAPTHPDHEHHAVDESSALEETLEQAPSSGFIPQAYGPVPGDEEMQNQMDAVNPVSRFTFEEEHEERQPSRYRRYWAAGSFILALSLCVQTAWFLRDSLITHDAGRQVLAGICSITGCELPVRRDTEQIIISNRTLTAHPEIEGILSLKLEMVNMAAFQQPFPKLQLSLYNDMGAIIARRTFQPHEYNTDVYGSRQMMPRLKAVNIALELQDPGNEVTGFKFDFL